MNIGKFYRTSILQSNAARLLPISCEIFNVLLALSVINQFSYSMEIILALYFYFYIGIIVLVLILWVWYHISMVRATMADGVSGTNSSFRVK